MTLTTSASNHQHRPGLGGIVAVAVLSGSFLCGEVARAASVDGHERDLCGQPSVLCLTQDGVLADPNDARTKDPDVGSHLAIRILVTDESRKEYKVQLLAAPVLNTLEARSKAVASTERAAKDANETSVKIVSAVVPSGSPNVTILTTWKQRGKDHSAATSIRVNPGRYFVEFGVMVPFTFEGKQTIEKAPLGTGGDQRYVLDRDWHIGSALTLNVFPGGRRQDTIGFWEDRQAWEIASLLGLQVGINLDTNKIVDRLYFGLVAEPVTGVSASFGAALVKRERLPHGVPEGALVTETRERTATFYAPSWYFGIMLSPSLFTSLTNLGSTD